MRSNILLSSSSETLEMLSVEPSQHIHLYTLKDDCELRGITVSPIKLYPSGEGCSYYFTLERKNKSLIFVCGYHMLIRFNCLSKQDAVRVGDIVFRVLQDGEKLEPEDLSEMLFDILCRIMQLDSDDDPLRIEDGYAYYGGGLPFLYAEIKED